MQQLVNSGVSGGRGTDGFHRAINDPGVVVVLYFPVVIAQGGEVGLVGRGRGPGGFAEFFWVSGRWSSDSSWAFRLISRWYFHEGRATGDPKGAEVGEAARSGR